MAWTLVAITLVLIFLRLVLRYRILAKCTWADYFVIFAWFLFVFETSLDTHLWKLGFFDGHIHADGIFDNRTASYADTVTALKIVYIEDAMYYSEMYCI